MYFRELFYFCSAASSANSSDCSTEMVALERLFDIFNLEGFEEKLVQSDKRQGIVNVKTVRERCHEVDTLLERADIRCGFASAKFHLLLFRVEPDLQLELLYDRLKELLPGFFQRRQSVGRDGH